MTKEQILLQQNTSVAYPSLDQHLNNVLLTLFHSPQEGCHASIVPHLYIAFAAQKEEQSVSMPLGSSMVQCSLPITVLSINRNLKNVTCITLDCKL